MNERHDHEHLPPPIGICHELPITPTEALKQLFEKDPDYARWVLFRSEELMRRLEQWQASGQDPRATDLKEDVAALLIEAYELQEALRVNKELRAMFEAE